MVNRNHEWILNFRHYEAVLVCTNEQRAWDRDQTLRCYQTYGFDDATTNGNELSFIHVDTGVMVLHDGGVVAIQFGDGNLIPALADLFTTLDQLGWRVAEVYHPQESLNDLLTDMGKAIPGHLDFDVIPANTSVASATESEEAEQMVELGMNLLQGVASTPQEAQQFNQTVLAEMQSMSVEDDVELQPASTESVYEQLDTPLELDDGDGIEEYVSPIVASPSQAVPSVPAPHMERIVFSDDDDALPIVPVIARRADSVNLEQQAQQPVNVQAAPAAAPAYQAPMPQPALAAATALNPATAPTASTEPAPAQAVAPEPLMPLISPLEPKNGSGMMASAVSMKVKDVALCEQPVHALQAFDIQVIKLGRSAICFDLPETPVEESRVAAIASELKAVEVVHIWPGLTNQTERWDLLSEIDLAAPWFAETIVDELQILKPVERILFAGALKKAAAEGLQIRELLLSLIDGVWVPDVLIKATQSVADSAGLMQSVFGKLGSLLLSEPGEAFLDTKPTTEASELTILSSRGISQDSVPRVYVVHQDACDGPFIETIVSLMMTVAHRYSTSTRNRKQADAKKSLAEAQEKQRQELEREAAVKKSQVLLDELVTQMKSAGLDLQALMPS